MNEHNNQQEPSPLGSTLNLGQRYIDLCLEAAARYPDKFQHWDIILQNQARKELDDLDRLPIDAQTVDAVDNTLRNAISTLTSFMRARE